MPCENARILGSLTRSAASSSLLHSQLDAHAGLGQHVRALAVGRPTRSPLLPEIPTLSEVGGGSDTVVPTYFTFVAPAGTPRAIVVKLNAELARIVAAPDMVERLARAGLEPQSSTPEEFTKGVKRDIARFGRLVNALGIPPQ